MGNAPSYKANTSQVNIPLEDTDGPSGFRAQLTDVTRLASRDSLVRICPACRMENPYDSTRCASCRSVLDSNDKKIMREVVNNKYFSVFEQDILDNKTGRPVNVQHQVVIRDNQLQATVQGFDVMVVHSEQRWNRIIITVAAESMLNRLEQMRQCQYGGYAFRQLLDWLESIYVPTVERIEAHLDKGEISHDGLWYIYQKGNRFSSRIGRDLVVGSEVVSTRYAAGIFQPMFSITGQVVKSDGQHFFFQNQSFHVPYFSGYVPFNKLDVQPMTVDTLAMLKARGKIFQEVAIGHHFMSYTGFIFYSRGIFQIFTKADGRVMVDAQTFNRMNPEYREFIDMANTQIQYDAYGNPLPAGALRSGLASQDRLSEDMLYNTWPTVPGFSFSAKKWGEIVISRLAQVTFDDTAYERLVLPDEKKKMIRALVEQNSRTVMTQLSEEKKKAEEAEAAEAAAASEGGAAAAAEPEGKGKEKEKRLSVIPPGVARYGQFHDIISGKGGGCIFLLHGPPGVGKTLTAEAVAELLHRPLYSVSVGELGTTTETLETRLQQILEVASTWSAVVLLDEADIFLEQRSEKDVLRNAMVGIFLRLLEYHQGVLFLTSNRVRVFDEAFHSRISVAIRYHELDLDSRRRVWENLLDAAGLKQLAVHAQQLAVHELNGRQIRTSIRLALALARSEGAEMSAEYIDRTVHDARQFETEILEERAHEAREELRRSQEGIVGK